MFISCTGKPGADGRCASCGCRVETTDGRHVRANDGYTVARVLDAQPAITLSSGDSAPLDHAVARFAWGFLTTPVENE